MSGSIGSSVRERDVETVMARAPTAATCSRWCAPVALAGRGELAPAANRPGLGTSLKVDDVRACRPRRGPAGKRPGDRRIRETRSLCYVRGPEGFDVEIAPSGQGGGETYPYGIPSTARSIPAPQHQTRTREHLIASVSRAPQSHDQQRRVGNEIWIGPGANEGTWASQRPRRSSAAGS